MMIDDREELAAHVERMKQAEELCNKHDNSPCTYTDALDDLLAHLRQSDAPQEKELVGYNCDVCHGAKFSGDDVVLHLCEGAAKPVYKTPECCGKCKVFTSAVPWGMCIGKSCPCHAPQGDNKQ